MKPLSRDIDDADLREQIADALRDTDRYGPAFTVLRQAVSGSRQNFLLRVDDAHSVDPALVWCRATHEAIDDSFAGRFTLAREAVIVQRLGNLSIRVPKILGTSASGRALIQSYIDERDPADAQVRERDIAAFFDVLDRVHSLEPQGVLPSGELTPSSSLANEVRSEVVGWTTLAQQLLASDRLSVIEQRAILVDVARRLEDVLSVLIDVPLPDVGLRLDLVHGDAGRANYIADHGGDVWIIDFELAHAGSRLEDFAWCELRGLEQDEAVWRRHIMARLDLMGGSSVEVYRYFRMLIYFRSVVAIAARIAADPDHPFVAYLARRFVENEVLGWLSAAALTHSDVRPRPSATDDPWAAFTPASAPRLRAWQNWTDSIDATTGAR